MITVCIGDSIVNGYPFGRKDSWPYLLEESLAAKSEAAAGSAGEETPGREFILNKGVDGQTTAEILGRFQRDVLQTENCRGGSVGRPDRVIISAGINDFIFTSTLPQAAAEAIAAMSELFLNECVEEERKGQLSGVVLLSPILSVPEMARESWADGTDYDAVNEKLRCLQGLLRDYAQRTNGTAFIDLQQSYAEWTEKAGNLAAYVDGIHPTKEGYRFIATFLEAALGTLSGSTGYAAFPLRG